MSVLILLNKPFDVLCQFTDRQHPEGARATLSRFIQRPGVYPAGRLDRDSEGLVLLTADGQLQHRIASPRFKQPKTYWVQVEGQITDQAITRLARGVRLKDGPTQPARVQPMAPPPVWERDPPVRERRHIPTSWLSLTLTEGRNRQVRRMTAAVGFPTLRLIRWSIGNWSIEGLAPGQSRAVQVHLPAAPARRGRRKANPPPTRSTSQS